MKVFYKKFEVEIQENLGAGIYEILIIKTNKIKIVSELELRFSR